MMNVHATSRFKVLNLGSDSVDKGATTSVKENVETLTKPSIATTTSIVATTTGVSNSDIEGLILSLLNKDGVIEDSYDLSIKRKIDHQALVGTLKSLLADNYCLEEPLATSYWVLTDEGSGILRAGSPEYQVFSAVPEQGINMKDLQDQLGDIAKIGLGPCMKSKWLVKKGDIIERILHQVVDETAQMLSTISMNDSGSGVSEEDLKNLKKRKLIQQIIRKSYKISKGPDYRPQRTKKHADLTKEMLGSRSDVSPKYLVTIILGYACNPCIFV
jgi:phenylalanyl-tRNA synthetase alpha chain